LWRVDWRRLARRAVLVAVVLLAAIWLYLVVTTGKLGYDFHGGMWKAGRDVLAGRSPYPPPNAGLLVARQNAFIPPPPLAVLSIPFALLPFSVAVALFNALSAAAFVLALFLLGVRDRLLYLVALCSFPFMSSLGYGQPDGLLALAAALAWRYRDSWPGPLAVGALIAAKLLAWPLVLWLVMTRRVRGAMVAIVSALSLLALSWGSISFKGLSQYPKLLTADAHAFEAKSYSVVGGAMHLGASERLGQWLAITVALVAAVTMVRLSNGREFGLFAAALAVGLLLSPILWSHYLVLLFVPLAITARRVNPIWLATAIFWIWPTGLLPDALQATLAIVTTCSILAVAVSRAKWAPIVPTRTAVDYA
jgi:hypothetical protein